MIAYDVSYEPPAPVVNLTVQPYSRWDSHQEVVAQLDTAADISVIPQAVVDALALPRYGRVLAEGYNGDTAVLTTYLASVELGGYQLSPVEVVAMERETVLLGRDIVNRLCILLDGPALAFEIFTST